MIEKKCLQCSKEFFTRYIDAKYCSFECCVRARRELAEKLSQEREIEKNRANFGRYCI